MAAGAGFTSPNLTAIFLVNHTLNHNPLQVIPIVMNGSAPIGPHYSHVSSLAPPTGGADGHTSSHVLAYVLVPLGSLFFIAAISFLVSIVERILSQRLLKCPLFDSRLQRSLHLKN